MVDKLENFMNKLNDMDWGWWPVLFLRPSKDKDIDNLVLFKLTLLFGSLVGLIGWLAYIWRYKVISWGGAVLFFLIGWILFFLVYKFTFAYFWNRRAKRLRIGSD
jgi:hypothetical protein